MPENIIGLDSRRKKDQPETDPLELMEQMSMIEDMLEQMDELGVSSREELEELLETLEAAASDTLE